MKFTLPANTYFLRILQVISVLVLLSVALFEHPSYSDTGSGKAALKNGKEEIEKGRFSEAARELEAAADDYPLLGDYALMFLAKAQHSLQDHERALATLRKLKQRYPESPLARESLRLEIREASETKGTDVAGLYEAYLRSYPDDDDTAMNFGKLLKEKGDAAKAQAIFKRIYIKAGPLAQTALVALNREELSKADALERAGNLMKRYEFRTAEQELRKLLSREAGQQSEEVLKSLGYSLFRQKEYREAAQVYERARDLYFKARSLYRAGDKSGFEAALTELIRANDRRSGELLLASASDKRRSRDFEGALKIYQEVLKNFPSEAEDALWGSGWTYYVSGDYRKATDTFCRMYTKYADYKYLYWQARSQELLGQDAGELYAMLVKGVHGYYPMLACIRTKKNALPVSSPADSAGKAALATPLAQRVEALLSLDMNKEAVAELVAAAWKVENTAGLLYAAEKLQELGEFKRSISLVTKLPYSEKTHRFWYPPAYRDEVETISRKYEVDPFLVLSVMREESRFDANAKSIAGARGLMQMMPQTAFHLDKHLKLGLKRESQIHDARNSIHLGAYYLKTLFQEFKSLPYVLAAYNAGENAVRNWDQQAGPGRPVDEFIEEIPYLETRNYVKKVITSYFQYRRAEGAAPQSVDLGSMFGKL